MLNRSLVRLRFLDSRLAFDNALADALGNSRFELVSRSQF